MRLDGRKLLGLPKDADAKEIKNRCVELLAWIETADMPDELEDWRQQQMTLLKGLYEHPDLVNEQAVAEAVSQKFNQRSQSRKSKIVISEAGADHPAIVSWFLARPVAMVLVGIVIALAALMGILFSGVFDRSVAAQDPSTTQNGLTAQQLAANEAQITQLEAEIKTDPTNTDILFNLGDLNLADGNWQESVNWLTQLLAVQPNDLDALVDMGTANMELGNYPEAYDSLTKVITADPQNVNAHYAMGFLEAFRADSPDIAAAIDNFQQVVTLAPNTNQAQVAQVHITQLEAMAAGTPTPTP